MAASIPSGVEVMFLTTTSNLSSSPPVLRWESIFIWVYGDNPVSFFADVFCTASSSYFVPLVVHGFVFDLLAFFK